jgi:radical SAM superfamily enzyme YgiQ (UPF0313 family)
MGQDILLAAINAKWIHPSLALRLLKANLGTYEDRAAILEFALRQPLREKLNPILKASPRILGISVSIWNHGATLELLRALHSLWAEGSARKPAVILGGPEVSHLPPASAIFSYADFIVQGEGEHAFRELCAKLLAEPPEIPPEKFIAPSQAVLSELDPGYRLYTGEDLSRKLVYAEAGRGCPFACAFCLSAHSGQREFPLDAFLAEMETLFSRGARAFKLLDRSFNADLPRALAIMEFFLSRLRPPQYAHFEMVPDRFSADLREVLRKFPPGTLRLEVGIQTFNPRTAAIIGRRSDPERELEVLDFLREETNALVHADLIAGLPGEDYGSFGEGFDRLWRCGPGEIQVGILKCLPGTRLREIAGDYGLRYAENPPYEAIETWSIGEVELNRLKNFARFWELIVNRGAFLDFADAFFPRGQAVFARFTALSERLFRRFGRNWGIPRTDLRTALEEYRAEKTRL